VKSDPKALFIISELCDKKDMLGILKSSTDNKKRYHAFKILSLFESDENYKAIYELARKDPDMKIRQEAEKRIIKGM
jgi:Cdc6-like AAA superfamily ATPase